jgi:lipoic acid synthetase
MKRKPEWLRVKLDNGKNITKVNNILNSLSLNTVCQEANCPNRLECFSKKTATFMILGNSCTRNCNFCDVIHGKPSAVDPEEPEHIASAVEKLGLKHVVITSVTRDDLEDNGAQHFANVVEAIRAVDDEVTIELLIPDLQGDRQDLATILAAKPDVLNHNVETISRLYDDVRPQANYERSLAVLENVKAIDETIVTKSGIMVGLGERKEEVIQVMKDLRAVDCDFITIGQYLPPSKDHYPLHDYVTPEMFKTYETIAYDLGFESVASGPMVRSSYNASEMIK